MMKLEWFAGVLGFGTLAALTIWAEPAAADSGPPPVTPVVSFDPTHGELPESLTADDDGHLFVSLVNGQIREVTPGGSMTTVAQVPIPATANLVGIKVGPDGLVYAISSSFAPDPPEAFVWRADPATGEVEKFATLDPTGFPNDLAFDDDGNLFVTDPFLAEIWKIDALGNASVWLADPLLQGNPDDPAFVGVHDFGVDGIAFDQNKRNLYVGVLDYGRVIRIPLGCQSPRLDVVVESPTLKGMDGIAIDRRGTIYAAVNIANRIATIDSRGGISVVAEGDAFDAPASIVFGTGHSDRKTIYVANFAIGDLAHPGVVSLPVQTPGLTLP